MNNETVKLLETIAAMETTAIIAKEFDKVLDECVNIDSSAELVAAFIIAMTRCGKGTIRMQNTN